MYCNLHSNKSLLISIIGLPRSGTTMFSNILNSYDKSFSLVEPKWIIDYDKKLFTSDKIEIDSSSDIITSVNKLIKIDKKFSIGCIKETYRIHQKEYTDYLLHDDRIDSTIFIFREPLSNFSSWKKTNWGSYYDDVDYFIECYQSLYQTYLNSKKKYLIIYENLCDNKERYLNKVFQNEIIFSEISEIKPTNFKFGDKNANSGGIIKTANCDFENLSDTEIQKINNSLKKIYNSLYEDIHNNKS